MKYKKTLITVLTILILYTLFGFFIFPRIVKPKLVATIEDATRRKVELGALKINPFALSVSLDDFALKDRDSTLLVSFHELYVNYEIVSLLKNAYVFSEFRLDTPYVAVRFMQDGKLSIADILGAGSPDTSVRKEAHKPIVIDNFAVTQGTIVYSDYSKPQPLRKVLDSLDLALKNFTTRPNQEGDYEFEAVTRQGERLHWKGNLSVAPPKSAGLIEASDLRAQTLWEFMSDRLNFSVGSGKVNLRVDYTLDLSAETPSFSLRNGTVDVYQLLLSAPADSIPPVSLPNVHVGGIAMDMPRGILSIDEVSVKGGELRTAYLSDGTLTIQQLLTPKPDPRDTSASKMTVRLKRISTSGFRFAFIDKSLAPEASIVLSDLNLELSNFVYGAPGIAQITAGGVLEGKGLAAAKGTLSMIPQKIDLDLQIGGWELTSLQPFVARFSRAELLGGTMSMRGKLGYSTVGKKSSIRFEGGISSDRGRVSDPVLNEDLARWDRLEMRQVRYSSLPPSLHISEIATRRPYVLVIVGPDRTLNIQHVMATTNDSANVRVTPKDSAEHTRTTIGTISVDNGSMNFSDLSLTPSFATGIQELKGSIKGLSSEQVTRADVDLLGKVDKYAPVTIKGQINPLSDVAFTDILMRFEGIELTTFTPYFGKFAGYKIERGKLTLDLQYKLNKRFLEANNKIVLTQLTLGEKVESPDATSLPVKLAIALLKDSKGVIDLDVPIKGSIDDPEFSFFPIILKALMNLLWKIVTAPFALLGALFGGGGDDLQYVSFPPAIDSLSQAQSTKLSAVAKMLTERPALQLDVRGVASDTVDHEALAQAAVFQKINPAGADLSTSEIEKRMSTLYQKTFNEDPEKLLPAAGVDDAKKDSVLVRLIRQKLLGSVSIAENDLRELAQRRARAVLEFLAQKQGIDPARIFLQEVDIAGKPADGAVRLTLALTAR